MSAEGFDRVHPRRSLNADIRVSDTMGKVALLTLLDLSLGGIGADGLTHFEKGKAVLVEFPDGSSRLGHAVWKEDFTSGIRFDVPLTPSELAKLEEEIERSPIFSPTNHVAD